MNTQDELKPECRETIQKCFDLLTRPNRTFLFGILLLPIVNDCVNRKCKCGPPKDAPKRERRGWFNFGKRDLQLKDSLSNQLADIVSKCRKRP